MMSIQDWNINMRRLKQELGDKRTKINELIAKKEILKYHFEIQYRLEETELGVGNVNVNVAKNADGSLAEGVPSGDVASGQVYANKTAAKHTAAATAAEGGGGAAAAPEQKDLYKSKGTAKGIKIQLLILTATIRTLQAEFDAIQVRIDAHLDAQPQSSEAVAFMAAAEAGAAAGAAAAAEHAPAAGGGGEAVAAVVVTRAAEAAAEAAGASAAQSALDAGKSKSNIILDAGLAAKSAAMSAGSKAGGAAAQLIPIAERVSNEAKEKAEKVAKSAGRQ